MKGHLFNIYFLLTLGPSLPKALYGHSVVEIQGDAFLHTIFFSLLHDHYVQKLSGTGMATGFRNQTFSS